MEAPAAISFSGIRHGIQATAGFFGGIAQEHAEPRLSVDEWVASGDVLVAFGRYEAIDRRTGKCIRTPIAHYWKFRDGQVERYRGFSNTAAFLEAAS